jgi:signal transduction histidine kinase
LKKILNDIDNQLIIGISSIVLFSALLIASIFVSQYRNITINQAEKELKDKTIQFTEIGKTLIQPSNERPRDIYFEVLKNIAGNEVWILDINGNIVLSSTTINTPKMINNILDFCSHSEHLHVTYDYSDHFNAKTMTMMNKIRNDNNQIIGYVLVHQDINAIYTSYQSLQYLVFVSLTISLLLSVLLAIVYSKFFTKPIEIITKTTRQIKDGNYSAKTGIDRDDQIGDLAKTIDNMSFEIETNIKEITDLESRAKELVANVSHEFKTPLTLIRGYTMNLKDKTIEVSDEVYDKIIKNTLVLEKLVNDLLDLNRYQSGSVSVKKEKINVFEIVNEVVSDMQKIATDKNIKILLNKQLKKDIFIEVDYFKMKQLLTIFIDNAIKFSDNYKDIVVNINKKNIEIIDNGIGMEKSELEKIFNRYYKVKDDDKGYGLGLCIAKYIADAHGFTIDIESKKNKGTNIKINFVL